MQLPVRHGANETSQEIPRLLYISDAVYSLSSYLQSQFIARPDSKTVSEEQIRIFVGCLIVLSNLLLLG